MSLASPPAPVPVGNKGILLVLHSSVLVCSAVASPIVGLSALTMLLAILHFFMTPGASYTGGGFAILILFIFILTPLCAFLHLLGLIAISLRRSTRLIWALTGGYMALIWIACLIGPDAVRSSGNFAMGTSMRPFYLFLAVPSAATLGAAVIYAKESLRKKPNA